jgi:bacterioferritin-associated ferredoxin
MNPMYICICKAVTEKRIARAVGEGATTLKDLRERTGLGTNCGKCVPQAYQLLRDSLDARNSPAAHHELATRTG